MKTNRRRAREAALRGLYMMEVGQMMPREALLDTHTELELSEAQFAYAERVIKGFTANSRAIDALISRNLQDWELSRLAAVDRNVLRLATYELLYEDDVPPAVTLDEAIELAKLYSTADSGRFVNGVLGGVLRESPKSEWTPPADGEVEEAAPVEAPAPVEEVTEEEAEEVKKTGFWTLRKTD